MTLKMDMGSLLEKQARERHDSPFVTMAGDDDWVTYGAFNVLANRLAYGLMGLGVKNGDYVCMVLTNSIDYLAFSYALKKIGAIEVSINVEFRGVGLTRLMNMTGAKVVVTEALFIEPLGDIADDLTHIETLVFIDDADVSNTPLARFAAVPRSAVVTERTDNPERTVHDTDVAQIQFTSGTTGLSKGLMSPHRHALRKAEGVAAACQVTDADCCYTPWPLFHSGAAHHEVLTVMLTGGRVVLRKRFSASRFWDEVKQHGATWFMIVGSVQPILCAPEPRPEDADNPIRLAWGCPYPIPRKTFEKRFGLKTVDCYGLEDCGLVTHTEIDDGDYESEGRPRDMYEIRIADENDDPVDTGKRGEILIRCKEASAILKGYFDQPEVTLEAFRNLWFHTGDVGSFDKDGRLHYHGRMKQVIRRRGENVMPREVEEVLQAHPAIEECVAVGVPSPVGEDDVKVFVVLQKGQELSAEELRDYCKGRMARFAIPEHVEFVTEIPRTTTHKPALSRLSAPQSNN